MKAIILAAGFGTRLKPLTDHMPKPLIPVKGIPLIFYNLALLKFYGITDLIINLHYLGDQIEALLGDGQRFGLTITYSHEPEILGTGGGIFKAASHLRGCGAFLVLNGDVITDLNLQSMIAYHQKMQGVATLALIPSESADSYGVLRLNQQGYIESILGKPNEGCGLKTFFSGLHIVSENLLALPQKSAKFCIIRDVYIPQLEKGEVFAGYLHKGIWNDLGTHERLAEGENEISWDQLSYDKILLEFQEILKKK